MQLIILTAILALEIIYIFFLSGIKGYGKEKGKNLATKEDIKEITQKIESVKNGLSFEAQAKMSLREERIKVLTEWYAAIVELRSFLTYLEILPKQNQEYPYYILAKNMDDADTRWVLKYAHIPLFVENEEILKSYDKIYDLFIEWRKIISLYSYRFMDLNQTYFKKHMSEQAYINQVGINRTEYNESLRNIIISHINETKNVRKLTTEEIKKLSTIDNI